MFISKHKTLHGIGRVANRFRGEISVIPRHGVRWALSKRNYVDIHLINGYYFETVQLDKCRDLILRHNLDCFLDIGANFGLYAMHLTKHAGLREVHAFEPVRQNFNQLCANIFLNRFDRIVTPYPYALSDRDETRTIYVESIHTGISRFEEWVPPPSKKAKHREMYSELAQVRRLDGLLDWRGRRLLFKVDTEGHEVEVIKGMTALLAANKAVLQIETQGQNKEALTSLLGSVGYTERDAIGPDCYFWNIG